MTKAQLGGTGTDAILLIVVKRYKKSLLTDANGIPLSVVMDGANYHEF